MARSDDSSREEPPAIVRTPQVRLLGSIGDETLIAFHDQLREAEHGEREIAVELTTLGGDADMGRRIALDVRLARERLGRRLLLVGKTAIYSAGATIMGGFPVQDRYFARDTVLLVHCRQLERTLELAGPLGASRTRVRQLLSEIDSGVRLQQEGYAALVEGSDIGIDEIAEKAETGWYITADEALERGLIAGIF